MKQTHTTTNLAIEATNISDSIVSKTAHGSFEQASMQKISDASRNKYMNEHSGLWQVNDDIRSMITFSTCNLHDDIGNRGHFDLIICLNVLLYFPVPVRAKLLDSFAKLLDPSGILVAGLNEPVLPQNSNFDMVRHESGIFYRQRAH